MHLPWSLGILSEDSASGTRTGKEKTRERSQGLKEREAEFKVSHSISRLARGLISNHQYSYAKSTVTKIYFSFFTSPQSTFFFKLSCVRTISLVTHHQAVLDLRACWVTPVPLISSSSPASSCALATNSRGCCFRPFHHAQTWHTRPRILKQLKTGFLKSTFRAWTNINN